MRFEYYHAGLDRMPKLSLDGLVPGGIDFSHWKGNQTPASVKADTSTEIALLVASPERDRLTQGIELVTNNHFDTDGVLSVWTMLSGKRALELRDKLIPAAEAGDFSELSTEDGVRVSIMIQGSDSPIDKLGSPLAQRLAGEDVNDEARSYELVLPYVERVLTHINEYETLWRDAWNRIAVALDSFAKGTSRVDEDRDAKLSVVTLAPEIFSPAGFDPTQHSAPFTAISHHARGDLFLIATPLNDGWAYRIDYPYYSWAETIVRPRIERHDFSLLITQLNESDISKAGRWRLDTGELASAVKFSDPDEKLASSKLSPDIVADEIKVALTKTRAVQARHA